MRENYTKAEYRVPMRDGTKLFTIVYTPKDASPEHTYPIVMERTCYSIAPYGPDNYAPTIAPDPFMMREKYIVVYQDVRGRYDSEGAFDPLRQEGPDGYDTVVVLSGVTTVLPTLEEQFDNIIPRISGSLKDAGSGWETVARASFYLHRSQPLEKLKAIFDRHVKALVPQREYCFVDGYSSPGKLCEVEVTATV